MKKLLIYILLVTFVFPLQAQFSTRWKRYRYELTAGIGTANFMGDLGGGANNNSVLDDYFGDFDFSATRPALCIGARYKISPLFSAKLNLAAGWVSGNDKWSADPARQNRGLNFNSIILEQSAVMEINILKENNAKRWSKKRNKRVRAYSFNMYAFAGVGGFYFNPYGYVEDEYGIKTYYNLYDVGTEGQNITKDYYSRYSVCFPYGIGIKIGINKLIDLGIEYGFRYTLTDYIDDVGGSYYDNLAIMEAYDGTGEERSDIGYLADNHTPSNTAGYFTAEQLAPGGRYEEYADYYEAGDRIPVASGSTVRSGDAKDIYMFLFFNVSYKIATTRRGLPKFR